MAASRRLDAFQQSNRTSHPAGSSVALSDFAQTKTNRHISCYRKVATLDVCACVCVCVSKTSQEGREKPLVLYFALLLLRKRCRDLTKKQKKHHHCLEGNSSFLSLSQPNSGSSSASLPTGDADWPGLIPTNNEKKG